VPDRRPQRLEALSAAILEAHLDAVLLTSLPNIRYITGFSGTSALALVTAKDARSSRTSAIRPRRARR